MTTCDLVTILRRPFFNLLHKIIRFSDFWSLQKLSLNRIMSQYRMILCSKLKNGFCKIVTKSHVVTKFNVTKSRSQLKDSNIQIFKDKFIKAWPPLWLSYLWKILSMMCCFFGVNNGKILLVFVFYCCFFGSFNLNLGPFFIWNFFLFRNFWLPQKSKKKLGFGIRTLCL